LNDAKGVEEERTGNVSHLQLQLCLVLALRLTLVNSETTNSCLD